MDCAAKVAERGDVGEAGKGGWSFFFFFFFFFSELFFFKSLVLFLGFGVFVYLTRNIVGSFLCHFQMSS